MHKIEDQRRAALSMLSRSKFRHYLSANLKAKVLLKFPQFELLFHNPFFENHLLRTAQATFTERHGKGSSWGEANSTYHAFQHYMIELLSRDTDFVETLAKYYEDSRRIRDEITEIFAPFIRVPDSEKEDDEDGDDEEGESEEEEEEEEEEEGDDDDDDDGDDDDEEEEVGKLESVEHHFQAALHAELQAGRDMAAFLRSPLLLSKFRPWAIPSDEELKQISMNPFASYKCDNKMATRIQWRFSAAAAAIQFFERRSPSTRSAVRNIVLHENKRSVADPERHMLGFIDLCSENTQLQIQRRLNVWKNFSIASDDNSASRFAKLIAQGPDDLTNHFSAASVGENYCKWITEAYALSAKGMPLGSFSLVFDGNPALEQSSQWFKNVKSDAAWHSAQVQWFTDRKLPHEPTARIAYAFYMSTVFPQAINDIVEGTSFISCNFVRTFGSLELLSVLFSK